MKRYITTPIYYVNGAPHIGHAYTTIIADALKKYYKLKGEDVLFLTGTDEHGQKIEQSAKKLNMEPQKFVDKMSLSFKNMWDRFNIDYDIYMRTTKEGHKEAIKNIFYKMFSNGDIYKDMYRGYYCVSCESFYTKTQLDSESSCPDCGKPTTYIEEENYFFRLSKYEDKIIEWYEKNDKCILPISKKNEVINFVKDGLKDLSITRNSFSWGIKLPDEMNDNKSVVYVWLDALMNYITALGYGSNDEKMMSYWNDAITTQIVGKDILKFHAIYWPAFLMSLKLPLPKHIVAHGWWTVDGEKMSKSKGNVIEPNAIVKEYGNDLFRYFLLKEISLGSDGSFSIARLIGNNNSELANDYGNLVSRTVGMNEKYFTLNDELSTKTIEPSNKDVNSLIDKALNFMENFEINKYIDSAIKIVYIANKLIEELAPWKVIKEDKDRVKSLLIFNYNVLYKVSLLLYPIMPESSQKVAKALNVKIDEKHFKEMILEKRYIDNFKVQKSEPIFTKIDIKKEEPKMENENIVDMIDISTFFKAKLKVATVVEAIDIVKSEKLYKLTIDIGEDKTRTIVAGIKKYYSIAELLDTQICVVSNLKPTKLMGIESQGMLLAAKIGDRLTLVRPDTHIDNGSNIG